MPPARVMVPSACEQFLDDDRRQPLGRLVQQQHLRIERQRAADRQHLLLAAGELVAEIVAALLQPRKHLVDLCRPSTARAAPPRSCSPPPSASGRCCAPAAPSRCRPAPAGPAASRVMSAPPSVMVPPKRRVMPTIELISVVLPVPLRPSSASTWLSGRRQRHVRQHHRLAVAGAQAFDGEQIRHRRPRRDRPPSPADRAPPRPAGPRPASRR